MKHLKVRVNNNLHNSIVVDGIPHEIEFVRFPIFLSDFAPSSSIVDDMELQLNPDNPSYRDIPAFCDVCDEWLDDCECPDIEKSVYG